MFGRLLVPVDGSEAGERAAAVAGELARRFDSRITLLHVQHIPESILTASSLAGLVTLPEIAAEAMEEGAREILRAAREVLHLPDDRVTERILLGHPAETIARLSEEGECDLIVMGRRGLSGIRGFLLGSVSDSVVHHAKCPVLIVH